MMSVGMMSGTVTVCLDGVNCEGEVLHALWKVSGKLSASEDHAAEDRSILLALSEKADFTREKQRGIIVSGIVRRTMQQRARDELSVFRDILQSNSRMKKRRARSPPRVKRRRASAVFFHFGLEPSDPCVSGRFRSHTADEL